MKLLFFISVLITLVFPSNKDSIYNGYSQASSQKRVLQYKDSIIYTINDSIVGTEDNLPNENNELVVFYAGSYKNDSVNLYVNNILYKKLMLTTSRMTGLAEAVEIGQYEAIKSIGIQHRNGKIFEVKLKPRVNAILIRKFGNNVNIGYWNTMPGFD